MSSSSPQDNPLPQSGLRTTGSSEGQELNRERKRVLSQLERGAKLGRMSSDTVNISAAMRRLSCDNAQVHGQVDLDTALSLGLPAPFYAQVRMTPTMDDVLQDLRTQRMLQYRQVVYINPLAKPSLQSPDDKNLFVLMDKVNEFLAGDGQVMLILGDSGAGKSTFNRHLEYELWKDYEPGDRIPFFINLPSLDRPEKELIVEQLRFLEFSEEHMRELKHHHKLLLICDGYDESQLTTNLHTTNNLNQSRQQDIKMIITCRSQYLGPDYRDRFVPMVTGAYHRPATTLFHEAVIAPFSKGQIENYVENYVPLEPRTWVTKDYMDRLTTIPNLMDLVKNPFLLTLSLEALPTVVEGKSDLSRLRVTRLQLYDIFVDHWLGVNKRRLQEQKLKDVKQEALDVILADGFKRHGILFQKELAVAIFREQDGRPIVDYSHMQDRETWKAPFFGPNLERTILRDSSLLSRAGNQYRFVHRSVLEYFFSCTIYEAADGDHVDARVDANSEPLSLPIGDHPLSKKSLVTEPSIIQFLAERVQIHAGFRKHLLALVSLSRTNEKASQAASNAITILVKAGQLFNGADLQDIRIPGADLTAGQFDSAQLQGADLTDVNLAKAWLRQASFVSARMGDVRLGELPYLDVDARSQVASCAFSPDGKTLATISRLKTISIFDTTTWTKLYSLDSFQHYICCLAYSPNGQQLVSSCGDYTVQIWSCESQSLVLVMKGHMSHVGAVAFSPCGTRVASGSQDGSVRLWNAVTGAVIFVLTDHNNNVNSVAYSPDGNKIASADDDGIIRIFDAVTGLLLLSTRSDDQRIFSLAYSPDRQWIISGGNLGVLRLWESATMDPGHSWAGHSLGVAGVRFSPNGHWIVSTSWDRTVKLWDSQTFALVSTFTGHMDLVNSAVFTPDNLIIASASDDTTVRLWEVSASGSNISLDDASDPRRSIAYSSDGRFLFCGSRSRMTRQHDSFTGEIVHIFPTLPGQANCVACSTDGLWVATCGQDKEIILWSTQASRSQTILRAHDGRVSSLSFSPCGRRIASGSSDRTVRLWDIHSGSPTHVFSGHRSDIKSVAFSASGLEIASSCLCGEIRVWDVGTEGCKMVLTSDTWAACSVVYWPGGSQVVSCQDGDIRLWDEDGKGFRYLLSLDRAIEHFAISSCHQWILTARGAKVHLWKLPLNSLSQPEVLKKDARHTVDVGGFFGDVTGIVWQPNALEFATACEDGSTRVWKLVPDTEYDEVFVQLVWGNGCSVLTAHSATFGGVGDLSVTNRKLLQQRGGDGLEVPRSTWSDEEYDGNDDSDDDSGDDIDDDGDDGNDDGDSGDDDDD